MNLTLQTQNIPLKVVGGIDGLLSGLRNILTLPRIQRVSIMVNPPSIRVERFVGPTEPVVPEFTEVGVTTRELLSTIFLEEVDAPQTSVVGRMSTAVNRIRGQGLFPTYIICKTRNVLHGWASDGYFFGIPVIEDGHWDNDMIVVCGSYTKDAPLSATIYGAKFSTDGTSKVIP